jgi:ABC-type glutathione transport system ATPase component
MSSEVLLEVNDLAVRTAQGATVLQGACLQLARGERLTIVGESGAGKSILAQAIMGTLPEGLQASGSVRIAGCATNGERALTQPLWGSTVTMLPQEPWSALSPLMRIEAQVAESAHFAARMPWAHAREAAVSRMDQLGVAHAAKQWLHQISGGMAQRVGVAASGLGGAALLLADEPTKGLDDASRTQVANLLAQMQSEQQALLTITHDLDLAAQLGGQLLVMQAGHVVESGWASDVLQAPQHAYTRALMAAQPKNWQPLVSPLASALQPVISGRGLRKAYGARVLFDALDIDLSRGEILAISGPSGCGKTTLGNILLGALRADAGRVQRSAAQPQKFQKLYQDPPAAFAPQRKIGDALNDLITLHRLDATRVEPLLHELRLHTGLLDRLPAQVSGGELQRIALLRLLLLSPAFIFADEPTSRLDVITQHETMKLLTRSAQEHDCAILLVSHDADLARASSHRHVQMQTTAVASAAIQAEALAV